jgi:iron complex transport system ATP-binding protein
LIEAADLAVARGTRQVLEGVGFRCEAGEFVALLGLNGAGKSTLLETIAGILPGYRGACRIEGRDVSQWQRTALSRAVSFLPQTAATPGGFSVRQVVAMGRYPHSGGWNESPQDREAIARALVSCGCESLAERRFGALSGGERQRVLLAAALCQEARVLVLDEPSAHVDLPVQAKLFALLREQAAGGTLCIAALHEVNLAVAFATRVLLIHDRSVVFDGPAEALLDAPQFTGVFGTDLRIVRDADGTSSVAYRKRPAP